MNIIDLISDPRIQRNIAPQKLLLLTQLSSQANIKSKEDLIPFFLNASSKANLWAFLLVIRKPKLF